MEIFKALSNKHRLQILYLLKEPLQNFKDEDEENLKNGATVGQIQKRSGLTQSTVSDYLSILLRVGLVKSKRLGQWTYYERNNETIKKLSKIILSDV